MDETKDKKLNGSITIAVDINTDGVVAKCRVITKHLSALADELESIDNNDDSTKKACKIIELLNELNDKDLEQITSYADSLFKHTRRR